MTTIRYVAGRSVVKDDKKIPLPEEGSRTGGKHRRSYLFKDAGLSWLVTKIPQS